MVNRSAVYKAAGLVVSLTAVVTVAFIGVLALVTVGVSGIGSRLPFYVLVLSVSFTSLLVALERYLVAGDQILLTASVISVTIAVVVALDIEGLIYATSNPGDLVASQLILYLVAAGSLCTGLIYWGVHHWREFIARPDPGSRE